LSSFFELIWEILPNLLGGLVITLELWVLSVALGGVLGVALALFRIYGNKPIYFLSTGFIEVIRGTPLLVQLFIFYYGLADIGVLISPFISAVIAMSINTSAYQAEYFRGAMQSIGSDQREAALSIGMSNIQYIFHILIPQMLRIVIPSWSNEAILMLKASSLAFMVTVPELMARGRIIASDNYRYVEVFVIVAVIYLCVVFVFTHFLDRMEIKFRIPGLGARR